MAVYTVRNVPEDVHRALKARAAQHGHSAEAEVREILAEAVLPARRIHLGRALADLGRDLGLTDRDIDEIEAVRDQTPAEPIELP
ncbi:hypothetical protein [Propionimicrobium sp. PCR01-08-3]|uniref:FitA-like ribbon-helix-helix domain-containing protein n=1 Tax=Propionimicrobium sp. PCR01-08-3 TaxID=3052086 RepID=UPI00255C6A1F|nr:hypothetical protein [Propionimicrobium sp. PCR01-08-3]WIY82363.1 hypothetical protein QQ658_12780 [Propionimicrobium sp. PCR01-08-3]